MDGIEEVAVVVEAPKFKEPPEPDPLVKKWAGLDDRLTDSGLISFQLCKAYAPPVGVKGQISTVCLYTCLLYTSRCV